MIFTKNVARDVFIVGAMAISIWGCDSKVPELSQSEPKSTIDTSEENGVVSAKLPANTAVTVVASPTSAVAGSSFSVPVGALAVETDISMGEAEDQSESILSTIGGNQGVNVAKKGAPLFIGPAETDVTVSQPMTLSLPLPASTDGQAALLASTGKLAFFYSVYTGEVWKSGVKAFSSANLVGTFLNQQIAGFGYFQIVYLTAGIEEREETTANRPRLKK